MNKVRAFVRHNSGIVISTFLSVFCVVYAVSCQSVVISTLQPGLKVNRQELVDEVDAFLARAETKFKDLDRQDLVKDTIFNSVLELAQGGTINPAGIALVIGNIMGLGAVIDNVRKRTHINTLKGGNVHAKKETNLEAQAKAIGSKASST